MKSSSHVFAARLSALALLASGVALGACSSAPLGSEETGRSTSSALSVAKDFAINQGNVNVILRTLTSGLTAGVSNGSLTISFSPSLPFKVAPISIAVPPVPFSASGVSGTATCTGFTLDPTSITATFSGTEIVLSASGSGTFQVSSSFVNPVVTVSATVSAALSYAPLADAPFVVANSLSATSWNVSTSGCGAFGWCNGLVTNSIDVNNMLQSYAKAPLTNFVASSQMLQLLHGAMTDYADLTSAPPANQTPWQYVPGTAYMGDSAGAPAFLFEMSAVNYPAVTPPPDCSASRDCDGNMFVYCAEVPSPVTQTVYGGTVIGRDIVGGQNAYTVIPGPYVVCDADTYNNSSVCQPIVEPPPPTNCVHCPVCPTGDMCEIVNGVGMCVVNHRCPVGYHFCKNVCVPGTGACP